MGRIVFPTSFLSARKCFSPIRLALARLYSSSLPNVWWLRSRQRRDVAPGSRLDQSPTPCCPKTFTKNFPTDASTTASTLSPAPQAQSFALEQVTSPPSAYQENQRWKRCDAV